MCVVSLKEDLLRSCFLYGSTTEAGDIAQIVQTVVAQNANTAY